MLVEVEDKEVVTSGIAVAGAKPFVVVGFPAFNEERSIARVVVEAQRFADAVVVCDDGSTDLTGEIAERLGAEVVRHERNFGYGVAVRSLFRRACELNADVLVTLDADGQHDPHEIPGVVRAVVEDGADIAIGSRFVEGYLARVMPWYRRAGVRFITKLTSNLAKNGVRDAQSGFRAYSRRALEMLDLTENGMGASVEILLEARRHGLRVKEVPASCRYDNQLKGSTRNPVRHGLDVFMAIVRRVAEERPLVFLGVPGILCLMVGVFFGSWMLQIYAVEHHIVTNIALASMAFVLIGFFLLSTAITLYAIARLAGKMNGK
jgi:glycosyltransferase involved in cell wall biosynthesis